jgi:hypothetical protein
MSLNGVKIADQRTALIAGAVCMTAGAWCVYQAFDARGSKRPWWLTMLPGL